MKDISVHGFRKRVGDTIIEGTHSGIDFVYNTETHTLEATVTGGGSEWGTITGTLADQTDLQDALDAIAGAASDAQADATQALADAATAEANAQTGITNAATAQGTANTALADAATAQGTANTALANAATAQGAADDAQADATQALADAATAAGIGTAAGVAAAAAQGDIDTHEGLTNNPHSVTKTQVGLSNVPNTDCTTTANITDSTNKRFVTDANLTVIGNTSGTNTGDQSLAGLVPTTRTLTINGTTHDLSANRTWTVSSALSIVTTDPVSPSNGDAWIFQESRAGESQGALGAVSAGVYLFRIKTADGIKQSNLF